MAAQLSNILNHRLDQLILVSVVDRRELGLYATPVTLLLAPPLGGVGAAIVSLIAYCTNFGWLAVSHMDSGVSVRRHVIAEAADVRYLIGVAASQTRRRRP